MKALAIKIPAVIALLCALLPFIAVHIAYIGNTLFGSASACIPYIEGCLSISRAARSGEFIYIFRAIMTPTALLLVAYWWLSYIWLRQLTPSVTRGTRTMRNLGVVGSLFLILYVTYLGTEGDIYRWMRRYGVTFYFSLTALAQILFIQRLYSLKSLPMLEGCQKILNIKCALCIIQWSVGLISLPLGVLIVEKEARDIMQNIVEWNFALAMNGYFLLTCFMFYKTGFDIRYTIKNASLPQN